MHSENKVGFATYIRCKKKIKWYIKLWNIITFRKHKNYEWKMLSGKNEYIR